MASGSRLGAPRAPRCPTTATPRLLKNFYRTAREATFVFCPHIWCRESRVSPQELTGIEMKWIAGI
eukprot:3538805-Pyramimonas_sp.AAC.1